MAELTYKTKITGPVTLRSGYVNGKVAVEVWFENRVIATILIEYVWDFLSDVFMENPPKNVSGSRGGKQNYIDRGRRYGEILNMRTTNQTTKEKV